MWCYCLKVMDNPLQELSAYWSKVWTWSQVECHVPRKQKKERQKIGAKQCFFCLPLCMSSCIPCTVKWFYFMGEGLIFWRFSQVNEISKLIPLARTRAQTFLCAKCAINKKESTHCEGCDMWHATHRLGPWKHMYSRPINQLLGSIHERYICLWSNKCSTAWFLVILHHRSVL